MEKNRVRDVLINMGMPTNLTGFEYIVDAVVLLDTPEFTYPQFIVLYKEIAKMHGATYSQVERAIRYAFEQTRGVNGDYEVVNHYIGFMNCKNSNSLTMLLLRIKQDMEEENED